MKARAWYMAVACVWTSLAFAADPSAKTPPAAAVENAPGELPGFKRPIPGEDLWIDFERRLVIFDGKVCLREGLLEMFACPKGTKEHESVVSINTQPQFIHAALLAVGAQAGSPVKFDPLYVPARGTVVDIYLLWRDAEGKKRTMRAQEWIRDVKSRKPMAHSWVFAGSGFWLDEQTGKQHYHADGGDFICVSNFSTAMLDLPIESSQANAGLQFEILKENVPPLGTKVRLVLAPRPPEKSAVDKSPAKQP